MTAVIPETAITETAASPSAHSPFRQRVAIVASLVFVVVVAFVFFISAVQRQLTAKEQLLVGAWEWQSEPGRMVLYFDDRGRSTYSQPPFTTFQFGRWRIDDNDHIYLTDDWKDLIRTVHRIVAPHTEVYTIRFSEGTPIFTMSDGTEKVLVPHTGNSTEVLRAAR
jgi:hypothetical protein